MSRFLMTASLLLALTACEQASEPLAPNPPTKVIAVVPADLVDCAVVGIPLIRADCRRAGVIGATAKSGVGAFNAPKAMVRDRTVRLQLAVGHQPEAPSPPQPVPTDEAPDPAPDPGGEPGPAPPPPQPTPAEVVADLPGEVVQYAPIVGQQMSAELVGEGFDIKALSPTTQQVTRRGVTTWDWEVKATRSGLRSLTMKTAVVFIDASGKAIPIVNTPRNFTVEVKVGVLAWVKELLLELPGWLKALAAVLVALGALVAAWRALRGQMSKQEPGPDAPDNAADYGPDGD